MPGEGTSEIIDKYGLVILSIILLVIMILFALLYMQSHGMTDLKMPKLI